MLISNFLLLNVGYAQHEGDWNFRDVNSPFTRIYYVTAGSAVVALGDEKKLLSPGRMYIIPAFTTHTDICYGHFEHYYVHIYEESSSGDSLMSDYEFPFEIEGRDIDRELFATLVSSNETMNLKSSDPKSYDNERSLIESVKSSRIRPLHLRMESAGIISQFVGRFIRYAHPKFQVSDERLRLALKMISSQITEPLAVEQLAAASHMSTGHFIRLFKEELGVPPMKFLIERKMRRAKLMLASESLMTKEIAYSLGYDDVSYFTRLFKKYVGTTPRLYRQTYNPTFR